MDSFINDSLDRIFNDFKNEIEDKDDLCHLTEFNYSNGHIPNYSLSYIQRLYLLRYLPSYLYEYYFIYNKLLFSDIIDFDKIKIVSIGSGCGLDFYSFYWSCLNFGESINNSNHYSGFDLVDWLYKDLIDGITPKIMRSDITIYNGFTSTPNIFIFPKSLGEFSISQFNRLLAIFNKSYISQDAIILISSARESKVQEDTLRFTQIANIILNKGYTTEYQIDIIYDAQSESINNFEFYYPAEIRDYVNQLTNYCKKSEECDWKCVNSLNRNPILSLNHMKYNYVGFRK